MNCYMCYWLCVDHVHRRPYWCLYYGCTILHPEREMDCQYAKETESSPRSTTEGAQ